MHGVLLGLIAAIVIATVPPPAAAQSADRVYRVGYLSREFPERDKSLLAAFRQGLRELGYVEGKNIVLEQRYAKGNRNRLAVLATDLIRRKVDVIVAGGVGAVYAKKATSKIPIVMTFRADPVGDGLVASLGHPGGNVTGLSDYHRDLITKRLELLTEVVPSASRIAVLLNPLQPSNRRMMKDIRDAAPRFGVKISAFEVTGSQQIDGAFAMMKKERFDGLIQLVGLGVWRKRIVNHAAENRLPAIYTREGWVNVGGLMSYGSSWTDLHRRAAKYVDRILKGARAADLPVEQPTRFSFTVSLKTARDQGITIPNSILLRADRVIE